MNKQDLEVERILSGFRRGALSRRAALRALGTAGLAAVAAPLLDFQALADEAGKEPGPGGIPLARPNKPVTLPVHGSPIKSGLKPEGGKFQIFNYQDYVDKAVMDSFAKKYDCEVVLTTFDSMTECITKLATGAVKPDVTNITPDRVAQAVAGKLLAPLNHDYLPNLPKNIWKSLQSPYYDQGSQYTVPYVTYSTGIGWRNDKVTEDIAKLDNPWSIFWNSQKYNGYVGVLDDDRESLVMAMLYRGKTDVNTEDPADIEAALADLKALVPICNPKINITEYQTLGDASSWLHQSWSGDMMSCAFSYLPEGTKADVLSYWTGPKEKRVVQNDCWAVLAKGQKPVLGHLWLNHLLDSEVALANFTGFTGYQPPQVSIDADEMIKNGTLPESLKMCILGESDFDQASLQEGALTPKGQALWQKAYARFNSGA
jgi:spermidine/putrescine transport system substrate-binding protein